MPRNSNHILFLTRQAREIERQHDRERKAKAVYGVFQHSSGSQGGYVAREGWRNDDGTTHYPSPYNDVRPIKEYKRRADADKDAHKRTFG